MEKKYSQTEKLQSTILSLLNLRMLLVFFRLTTKSFSHTWALPLLFLFVFLAPSNSIGQSQTRFAGAGANSGGAGTGWTNPGRIVSDNNSSATVNATSEQLLSSNHGFTIPAGSVINGIELQVERNTSNTSGGRFANDNTVRLIRGGTVLGDNKAVATNYGTSFAVITYGSPTDLWGTTWTVAQINANNFGAAFSVNIGGGTQTVAVDFMRIIVYYTLPPTITNFTPTSTCAGEEVVITGTNFTGATEVNFNGVAATSFTVDSATQITAIVPSGITTGKITVTTPGGTATSAGDFTPVALNTAGTASSTPTLCINTALVAITHTTTGTTGIQDNGVSGASGLPAGVSASWTSNTITISGTPTESGTFNYTIPLTGGCGTENATGTITVNANVVSPTAITISAGTEPTCQLTNGTTTTTYATTATNNTGFNWSLSNGAAGTISATTGVMTWANGFSGTVDIQVTANGCNGPTSQVIRTVTITPTVGTPTAITVSAGTEPTCQLTDGTTTTTYTTTATNNTGFNWSLSNGAAGSINATTGVMTWANGFSGTVDIRVTANGCNGPSVQVARTVSVTSNNTVGVASSTPTLCINTTLIDITHTTTYTTGIETPTNLPAGLTASWASNTITISGIPTVSGTFNYDIPLVDGCGSASATGTIVVENPVDSAGTISGTATVCQGQNGVAYSVPVIANATGYTWTLPSGATIATGANTNSITVNYGAAAISGDITVYGTNSCGNGIVSTYPITVDALPVTAGTIIGTAAVCQGQTGVAFSVPVIANATDYVWTLPAGATLATGANTESITVDFSASAVSGNITVYGTNACGNGIISANYAVTVNTLSIAPISISATTTICEGNSTTLTVNGGTVGTGGIIEWFTDSCGGTSAGIGNSITVSPILSTTYYVRYNSTCNTTLCTSETITVNPLPVAAGTITGTASVCQGQNGVTYSVPAIANATDYIWSLPSGATIATGANTNSIAVDFSATAISGNITVLGRNACGDGIVSILTITVNPLPVTAGTITGTAIVCQGQNGVSYSVPAIINATNYIWTLPSGATIATGANTNAITVDFSVSATSGNITVQGTNACGNGIVSANYPVTVNTLSIAPTSISGTTTICEGASTTLTLVGGTSGTGATAEWFTASCGGTSAGTGNSITVSPITTTSYYVRYNGTCNTSACSATTVTVNPLPLAAGVITGSATVCQGQNSVVYSVPIIANATNYIWTLPFGASITAGTGTNVITVSFSMAANSGNITVQGTNACGTGAVSANYGITVNITPSITINYSTTICSAGTATILPTNGGGNIVPPSTTYSWGLPTVTGGITGATALSGQTSFVQTLTNPTNIQQTASYNVTASTNGCSASTFSVVVYVDPKPTVGILTGLSSQSICSGANIDPITFNNPNTISGTIDYNWTRNTIVGVTGMATSGNGATISGNLSNSTNAPQTIVFSVTATTEDNCTSDPFTVSVIVNPVPTVTITNATQNICSEGSITTIGINPLNGVVGTTYSWTSNNPNITGIPNGSGFSISGSLTNSTNTVQTTTFTISATANGCTINSLGTATITVKPKPIITVVNPATQTLCGGVAINPITYSSNVAGTIFGWSRISSLIGMPTSGSGTSISGTLENFTSSDVTETFTITATVDGCSSSTTVQVIVKPKPQLTITNNQQSICNNTAISSITMSSSNSLAGTSFSWTRNNANITGIGTVGGPPVSTNPITGTLQHSQSTTQTTIFSISVTASNGCSNSGIATVNVYAPLVAPVIGTNQTACLVSTPNALTITTPPSGGSGVYTYQWQSSPNNVTYTNIAGQTNNSYQPAPIPLFGANNTYYRLIVSNLCGSVTSNFVVIQPADNGSITTNYNNLPGILCPGSSFTPTVLSSHFSFSAVRYGWTANAANITPATGGPVGSTGGSYFFGIFRDSSASIGPLTAQNTSDVTVISPVVITPYVYDYNATGAVICTLQSYTINVTIRPTPRATATVPSSTICSNSSAGIEVRGNIQDSGNTTTFNWTVNNNPNITGDNTSGSGSIGVGGNYIINNTLVNNSATTQNVIYTITPVSNGCTGTPISVTISVAPAVTAGTIAANQTICSGSNPIAFTQTAPTGSGTLTYEWQSSTTGLAGSYSPIPSSNIAIYAPSGLTTTTWFIRTATYVTTGPTPPVTTGVTYNTNGATCSQSTTPIIITVNNINPGSIAGNQTICSGGIPVAFTSVDATGGGVRTYQWEISTTDCNSDFNNITINGNNATYTVPTGLTVTTYYRRKVTYLLNGVNCSAYSNCITITINNVTGGTIGSDQTLCGNNPAAFTVITPSTGSGTLRYEWQSSTEGCSSGWNTIGGATGTTYDAPAGLLVTTYYRRITYSLLNLVECSASSNCITVTINSVTPGTISGNRTVCYGGNPTAFTETPGTGTGLQYQWQISTSGGAGPWTNIIGATNPDYDEPGPIYQNTFFRRVATATLNGNNCSANSNFVTVFVNEVTPTVIAGNQNVCNTIDNPSAFTIVTPATGTSTLTYQWQSSTTGCSGPWNDISGAVTQAYDSPPVTQTTYFQVRVTSTLNGVSCTAFSNCIEVTSFGKLWNGSASTAWENDLNWTPNGVPDNTNCVIIPNVTNKPVISGTNYEAFAHSLSILANSSLLINSSNNITVTDFVNVNPTANFTIQNNASLVQHNDSAVNTGHITYTRTTRPVTRWAYVYWGSPVVENVFSQIPNQFDLRYRWQSGTLDGAWMALSSVSPGQGFIARVRNIAPFSTGTGTIDFVYQGTPGNGVVTVPVDSFDSSSTGPGNTVLLANPYPSAIDAEKFLTYGVLPTNLPENNSELGGTIFFWTSVTLYSGTGPYNVLDYGSWNLSGGVGTAPSTDPSNMSLRPNGKIAAGQGFFAQAYADGNITFNNSMRVTNDNHQFFRSSNATTSSENSSENNRIWLNIYSNTTFRQMMVNYKAEATNGLDTYYDGVSFTNNEVNLYSILGDKSLAIQGRGLPFDQNDVVPLGYKITNPGMYSIAVDELDGLFLGDQTIYLRDNLLGIDHNIKQSPYTFNAVAGTFENRFEIVYVTNTLGVNNPDNSNTQASIINNVIRVESSEFIKSVKIYDISGKLINRYKLANVTRQFSDSFNYPNGIYIAEITLENDMVVKKKLIH
ncbi:PKD-like domain-containing protein [Flavobacterium sp. UBA7682]|uniref:PKD-like domain-containing protein n=1 Tax=Flavobacterium sp. UBA7682 TaxID=1946560 RepID=UPI0025B80DB8|nr:PKD-like domain-containing protein [Flavobacterium sp. UBA7682]